jgi:hypothetical protein
VKMWKGKGGNWGGKKKGGNTRPMNLSAAPGQQLSSIRASCHRTQLLAPAFPAGPSGSRVRFPLSCCLKFEVR